MERQRAIERYGQGESVTAICRSLKRSREWFYKWQARAASGESAWARSVRGGPRAHRLACRTPWRPGFSRCARVWSRAGSFAAPRRSRGSSKSGVREVPSVRTIHRVLVRAQACADEPRRYVPKGGRIQRCARTVRACVTKRTSSARATCKGLCASTVCTASIWRRGRGRSRPC